MTNKELMNKPQGPALQHSSVAQKYDQQQYQLEQFLKLMLDGEILHAATHHELLASSRNFQDLVNAHKETAGSERLVEVASPKKPKTPAKEIKKTHIEKKSKASEGDQLIKQEEREVGDIGLKPYIQYLNQNRGCLFFSMAALCHLTFVIGQILQSSWIAANVENPQVSTLQLITVYLAIGFTSTIFLLSRSLSTVSSDLSTVDLDVPFSFIFCVGATTNAYSNLAVLAVVTWPVLLVSRPIFLFAIHLQRYYFATAKELMQLNGTTKSLVANHLAESIAGSMTIRAFEEEDWFFVKNHDLIDVNATLFFHSFAANEWLIQQLETLAAVVLSSSVHGFAPFWNFQLWWICRGLRHKGKEEDKDLLEWPCPMVSY
ncbi:hypothetical protein HYC85_006206 [Camellia sinensis]|uniref:ABC transmembrane type-1 domain-containing protein n=1 Tax=Camellia sinensis TaxID=4442 RepID=A0A7J7HKC3_CAMSI|nr:hypothetical protein HYC85_006206 [Camellia sinensis]